MGGGNRRGTEPYARWCERTGEVTPPPTRSIPEQSLVEQAGRSLSNILEKQIELRLESTNLSTLRDTLLPKLLSGELSVIDDLDQRAAEPRRAIQGVE